MTGHELWHIFVLVTVVLGAGGLAIVALGAVVFDEIPEGVRRVRPWIAGVGVVGAVVVTVEWLGVH